MASWDERCNVGGFGASAEAGPVSNSRGFAARFLCAAQGEQRDLRRHAEADGRADGAEAAIDVERGRLVGWRAGPCFVVIERRRDAERTLVQTRDIGREELRG